MKTKFTLTLICCLLANYFSFAQLHITTNTTWSTDQILTQSVIVDPGATLTITEGVMVQPVFIDINSDLIGDISIVVNGEIKIKGSPCNPVIFKPYDITTNKKYWTGITINSSNINDSLYYFKILYANNGLNLYTKSKITGCEIKKSQNYGANINMINNQQNLFVNNLKVIDCGIGININKSYNIDLKWILVDSSASTGLFCDSSNININHSIFSKSIASGVFASFSTVSLKNTRSTRNNACGIVSDDNNLTIDYCDIDTNSMAGIILTGDNHSIITNSTIKGNTGGGVETTYMKLLNDFSGTKLLITDASTTPTLTMNNCNIMNNHSSFYTLNNSYYETGNPFAKGTNKGVTMPFGYIKQFQLDKGGCLDPSSIELKDMNLAIIGQILYTTGGGTFTSGAITDPKISPSYYLHDNNDSWSITKFRYYFGYGGYEFISNITYSNSLNCQSNYWGTISGVNSLIRDAFSPNVDYSAYSAVVLNNSHSDVYLNNITSSNFPNFSIGTSTGNNYICTSGGSLDLYGPAGTSFTYNWLYNAVPFGVTTQNYTTSTTGTFSVAINNGSGCAMTSAPITILQATAFIPAISTIDNPIGCIGDIVHLISTTSGGMNYQWYKNGSPIIGATNSTYNATTTGNYYIVAINSVSSCSYNSNTISINLVAYPVVSISTVGLPVINCEGSVKNILASPTINLTYQWYKDNVLIPASDTSVYQASQAGTYFVIASNSNGCKDTSTSVIITHNHWPVPSITLNVHDTTICIGNSLSLTASGGQTYLWAPSAGLNTTSGSTVIATPGTTTIYTVTVTGSNGCSATNAITIHISTIIPTTPTTGNSGPVCEGTTLSVNASTIAGATYIWTGPNSFTSTSQSPTVSSNATIAMAGTYTVTANLNGCLSTPNTTVVTVNPLPASAGTISGLTTVCQGQNSVTYTVPVITNATSYVWTLPSGATGTSSTNSITVNYGTSAVSGNITVKGNNTCGDGAISTLAITVNPLPADAGTISGLTTVCQGQNSVTYTVPTILNATSYIWTLPAGATGTSTTNSITVNYSVSAVFGDITVKGNNTCGDGATSTLAITVNPLPADAGTISGLTTVCQGQNSVAYTVPTILNATSYIWTLPVGATGTSSTNNIIVNYGTSAVSGDITVKGNNSCGNGVASNLAITIYPIYSFTENHSICDGETYNWQGTNYTTANTYTASYTSINGCDSVYILNLSVNSVNISLTVTDPTITANASGAIYQWLDCNNAFAIIPSATLQSYTASANGNYAVMITQGLCTDTSACIQITTVGIASIPIVEGITVYPNPVTNELIIENNGNTEKINFEILNSLGQVVFKGNLIEKIVVQTEKFSKGVYLIKLENGKTFEFKKIIKE